jgi:ribosome-associated translation inhibitor RaiA
MKNNTNVCIDFPPTILITAFPEPTTLAEAKRLGVKAIFSKPFNIDDLLSEIIRIIPLEHAWKKMLPKSPKMEPGFRLEISFRHPSASDPIEAFVRDMAMNLRRFRSHIEYVRVVIDTLNPTIAGKHRYDIKIQIGTPGTVISVNHSSQRRGKTENVYMAISLAFSTAIRRLKRHIQKQQNKKSRNRFSNKSVEVNYE